jgi:hypothetical protein
MVSQQLLTQRLLDRLWTGYTERVAYARRYAELVTEKGGRVVNDHCAFRTFNCPTGEQPAGIEAIGTVLESLGYLRRDPYAFPSKHLNSFHYQHPDNREFPKFFVTQLEVDALSEDVAELIKEAVDDTPDLLGGAPRALLAELKANGEVDEANAEALVEALVGFFARPWAPPKRLTVLRVNDESQFAAWTLLHGNAVNHFTAYVNFQEVPDWPDIEATAAGLSAAGVPMKDRIEGEPGSKLRQTSTQAVDEECAVTEADGSGSTLTWSYAYYELAERGTIEQNGEKMGFDGFLGEQATNLFEMTKR